MDKVFRRGVAVVLAGAFLSCGGLRAQNTNTPDAPDDGGTYVAPAGGPPPVAPPLNPNSPLYHLAHDTKYTVPTVGYREGNTTGDYWIAHRGIDTDGGEGWGWVRHHGGGWKWIALQETPGLAIAPHRRLATPTADADWDFKFWGYLATYRAYDPHLDELVPVFVLQGYEVIGPANPLTAKIGPPGRIHSRPSGASSRMSSPILSDPGVD